ncbi:MAG: hypothetical protein JRM80_13805 [Nitrososphaerota archaeon]|nr:hypothetical protein [Nitrososphaerota archaeon]
MVAAGLALPLAGVVHAAVPAIDGSGSNGCYSSSGSCTASITVTTTQSNDWIYFVLAYGYSAGPSAPTTPTATGLTFNARCTLTSATNNLYVNTYYALASTAGAYSITAGTGASKNTATMVAFGVSGADSSNPFDRNLGSCAAGSFATTATSQSDSASTTGTADLVVGFLGAAAGSSGQTVTSGSTLVTTATVVHGSANYYLASAEYSTTTSSGTQQQSYTLSASPAPVESTMGIDAFVTTAGIPVFPYGVLPLLAAVTLVMYFLKVRGAQRPRPS